jgi:LCP family protein required for cell wall assembly
MRRIAKFLGRTILLLICLGAIYWLSNSALNGIRDTIQRLNTNRFHSEQQAVFPGTATAINEINVRLSYDKTHAPTQTPTESEDTPPPEDNQSGVTEMPLTQDTVLPAEPTMPDTPESLQTAAAPGTADQSAVQVAALATATNMPPTDTVVPTAITTHTPTATPIPPTIPPTMTATATDSAAPTSTAFPTNTSAPTQVALQATLPPTNTKRAAVPTATPTVEPSAVPTTLPPTIGSNPTAASAATLVPTPTSASSPQALPTSKLPVVVLPAQRTEKPQPTAIPTNAPRVKANGNDILNILLIGSDADLDPSDPDFRTDTMVIVSVNRTTSTVAMLSIPRDLYVYIPSLGMQRINTAYHWGQAVKWQPGGGFGLLQQTILYNLGIPVHYYGRISFTGFKQIIDTLHGIDLSVDCPISDLRFQGQYDEKQTPVYSPFKLDPGYYHMDGSLALWYARMRHQTSDFDRNRRQQQILRAIWRTARDQGLITKAAELWGQVTSIVETNLPLGDALGLVPIALNLKPGDIASYYMLKGYQLQHWRTPAGEDVQLPDPAGFFQTINDFYTPPTSNRLSRDAGIIEVVNGTPLKDMDKVAADVLAWNGFEAQSKGSGDPTSKTMVYDYTGSAKPGALAAILKALNLKQNQVVSQPDPNRTVDYRIVLGSDYKSCTASGFN